MGTKNLQCILQQDLRWLPPLDSCPCHRSPAEKLHFLLLLHTRLPTHPHRVLPPSLRLVLLSHTTFPWSLATAHLTAPHSSIWISSAAPIIFGGVGLLTSRVGVWLVGADLQGWWCGAFSESTWNKKWGHSMHRLAKSYPSYFKQKEEKRL